MSEPPRIRVRRLAHGADLPLPRPATAASAGCDLHAAVDDAVSLQPGQRRLIPTGFCLEIPAGYEAQVRPRSGIALRAGVTVLNSPGTIDADYRGEVGVLLIHLGQEPFRIERGDRIAQMIVAPVTHPRFEEVAELADSERGAGGFGSTGQA